MNVLMPTLNEILTFNLYNLIQIIQDKIILAVRLYQYMYSIYIYIGNFDLIKHMFTNYNYKLSFVAQNILVSGKCFLLYE